MNIRAWLIAFAMVGMQYPAPADGVYPREGWRLFSGHFRLNIESGVMPASARALATNEGPQRYDARAYLAEFGILLPEDAVAIADAKNAYLVVIGPNEAIALVETLTSGCDFSSAPMIETEMVLADFEVARTSDVRDLPYARIRALAGTSWHERNSTVVRTKNGERGFTHARVGDEKRRSKEPATGSEGEYSKLVPGEAGTTLEVEPTVGPDGQTIDLRCAYHHQAPQKTEIENFDITSHVLGIESVPLLLCVWPRPGVSAKGHQQNVALVVRMRLLTLEGTPFRDVLRENIRKVREKTGQTSPSAK